jgi:hypothetical protein
MSDFSKWAMQGTKDQHKGGLSRKSSLYAKEVEFSKMQSFNILVAQSPILKCFPDFIAVHIVCGVEEAHFTHLPNIVTPFILLGKPTSMSLYYGPLGTINIGMAIESLQRAVVNGCYAASLVPFLLGLLLIVPFPKIKSKATYAILLCSIAFGITQGFLSFILQASQILDRNHPKQKIAIATNIIVFLVPVLTDTALIFRIASLSKHQSPRLVRLLVALPVFLKFARIGVASALVAYVQKVLDFYVYTPQARPISLRLLMAQYCLQFADACYCSAILLYYSYKLGYNYPQWTDVSPLQMRCYGLLASYLVPCGIRLTLLADANIKNWNFASYVDVARMAQATLQASNLFLSVQCAIFATIWSPILAGTKKASSATKESSIAISSNAIIHRLEKEDASITSTLGAVEEEESFTELSSKSSDGTDAEDRLGEFSPA